MKKNLETIKYTRDFLVMLNGDPLYQHSLVKDFTPLNQQETPIKILKAGCGFGMSSLIFIKDLIAFYQEKKRLPRKPFEITLLDNHPSVFNTLDTIQSLMNNSVAKYYVKIHINKCDLSALKPSETYDFVMCNNVLHYFQDDTSRKMVLDNMISSLEPYGQLFVTVDDQSSYEKGETHIPPITKDKMISLVDGHVQSQSIQILDSFWSENYPKYTKSIGALSNGLHILKK